MLDDIEELALQISHLIPFIWFRCFKGKYTNVACLKATKWFVFALYGLIVFIVCWTEASNMELFAKIVNEWKLLTIFEKNSILDVWQGSEYASAQCKVNCLAKFWYMLEYILCLK